MLQCTCIEKYLHVVAYVIIMLFVCAKPDRKLRLNPVCTP